MEKVTAGRDYLGAFAPQFAALNDDVLFGQVWADEATLSPKMRSMITISVLLGSGILDESLKGHITRGAQNGITKEELVALITQAAFYAGWPKAWAAFAMVEAAYADADVIDNGLFPLGEKLNDDHFVDDVYVSGILGFEHPMIVNYVTFMPGSRNAWHVHQVGQTLLVTEGMGWYQAEGEDPQLLRPGDVVRIPGGVKHWHGATKDHKLAHLAIEAWEKGAPEWFEHVAEDQVPHV